MASSYLYLTETKIYWPLVAYSVVIVATHKHMRYYKLGKII